MLINRIGLITIVLMGFIFNGVGQEVINLPITKVNPEVKWDNGEKEYFSDIWQTQVVTNVSKPTITIHKPKEGTANGTSVVICPGGGLYAHSINSEGHEVAKWLTDRGVTAFVLKYRLVPTGEDGVKDIMNEGQNVQERVAKVLPMSIDDGLNTIAFARKNASKYGIDPNRIGIMGFSAGGAVTMGVTYNYTKESRPDFIAPIYAWMDVVPKTEMPLDAPPIFVACASDDPLNLAPASVLLFDEWLSKGKPAELHMYAKGGHGFGMRVQNLPSDKWIEHFGEWLKGQGWM